MTNIRWFNTLKEYRQFIESDIVVSSVFRENPFYRGLVDFIIDHRTPIFFSASEAHEYSHFTQYFNFVLIRGGYKSRFVEDMFFAHDFVHMVFDNPLNLADISFEYFCEVANYNEYVASNDTEILTYYRMPECREKGLEYPILYDLLKNRMKDTPNIEGLLNLRKKIVFETGPTGLESEPNATKIFAFLRKFKDNNRVWCKHWYEQFPKIAAPYYQKRFCLPLLEYDVLLKNYKAINSEELFRKNTLENIRIGLAMLGEKDLPEKFEDCKAAITRLDGKVIMNDVAKTFYDQYMESKKREAAVQ